MFAVSNREVRPGELDCICYANNFTNCEGEYNENHDLYQILDEDEKVRNYRNDSNSYTSKELFFVYACWF